MDFTAHWSERTEIRSLQLVDWMGLSRSKLGVGEQWSSYGTRSITAPLLPNTQLAPAQTHPVHKLQGADLGALRPMCGKIHDRVANIVCHPKGPQVSPSSFLSGYALLAARRAP